MKKCLLFICLIFCLLFSSCSAHNIDVVADTKQSDNSAVDVDLTELSTTMIYSEISNMLITPEDYIGKTIKMDGQYTEWIDKQTDEKHYACYIMDATACCQQGFEFVLSDDFVFENHPAEEDNIEIIGTFETYNQGELIYCRLVNANMIVL